MNKILICILTCLILTCCGESKWNEKNIVYYKVENFRIITKQATAYVPTNREIYTGNVNVYEMNLIKDNDTIHEIYVTTRNERFIDGDSVFLWFNKWLLKN